MKGIKVFLFSKPSSRFRSFGVIAYNSVEEGYPGPVDQRTYPLSATPVSQAIVFNHLFSEQSFIREVYLFFSSEHPLC